MTYGFSKDIASGDFKLQSEEYYMPASGIFFILKKNTNQHLGKLIIIPSFYIVGS
jgi:hypothetical protein